MEIKSSRQRKKFKDIAEAYSVLMDKKKREIYDAGGDLDWHGGMDFGGNIDF